jgi:predicted secreted protein
MATTGEFIASDATLAFLEYGSTVDYYDLSTYVNEVTLSRTAGEAETTTLGTTYRQYIRGLKEGELSFTIFYNNTPAAAQRPHHRVRQMFEDGTRTTWRVRPQGAGTGKLEATFSGTVTGYEEDLTNDDQAVSAAITVRVNGAITDTIQS